MSECRVERCLGHLRGDARIRLSPVGAAGDGALTIEPFSTHFEVDHGAIGDPKRGLRVVTVVEFVGEPHSHSAVEFLLLLRQGQCRTHQAEQLGAGRPGENRKHVRHLQGAVAYVDHDHRQPGRGLRVRRGKDGHIEPLVSLPGADEFVRDLGPAVAGDQIPAWRQHQRRVGVVQQHDEHE